MAIASKSKPKSPVSHKKRVGNHHRKSKHYMKAYWPYMPMLLVVGLGLMVNSIWSNQAVLGASSDFSQSSLLDQTNQQRQAEHEPSLSIDPLLSQAAQSKANDMVANDYWAHTSPAGKTPWTFIAASGYSYQRAGENLAYGFSSAGQTIDGWMNSPEHRANILEADYQNVGFGIASAPQYQGHGPQTVVVAMYAEPVGDSAATISFRVPETQTAPESHVLGAQQEPDTRLVSRVQVLTNGHAPWSLVLASTLMVIAILVFVTRHGWRLHRLITRGELFVVHHPVLDTIAVIVATLGFILTRTSGLIR